MVYCPSTATYEYMARNLQNPLLVVEWQRTVNLLRLCLTMPSIVLWAIRLRITQMSNLVHQFMSDLEFEEDLVLHGNSSATIQSMLAWITLCNESWPWSQCDKNKNLVLPDLKCPTVFHHLRANTLDWFWFRMVERWTEFSRGSIVCAEHFCSFSQCCSTHPSNSNSSL